MCLKHDFRSRKQRTKQQKIRYKQENNIRQGRLEVRIRTPFLTIPGVKDPLRAGVKIIFQLLGKSNNTRY